MNTQTNSEKPNSDAPSGREQRLVSPLELEGLEIKMNRWGPDKGRYTANIKYSGKKGEITMRVSSDITHDLLRYCGGAIKRFSESAAAELQTSIDTSIAASEANTTIG